MPPIYDISVVGIIGRMNTNGIAISHERARMSGSNRMASESGDGSGLALPDSAEIKRGNQNRQTYSWVTESMLLSDGLCRRNLWLESRGPIMSVLCQRKKETTAIVRNRDISSNWGAGVTVQRRITAPVMRLIRTLPRTRREKVLVVRQQIADGTYDLEKRLNSALDRLLKVLAL